MQEKLQQAKREGLVSDVISDDDDMEEMGDTNLNGGFKIPTKIWSKLYKYELQRDIFDLSFRFTYLYKLNFEKWDASDRL